MCCVYLYIKSDTIYLAGLGVITGSLNLTIRLDIRDNPGTMTNDFSKAPEA